MSMHSRPFILYGRSQLEAYKRQIEHALDAWLQHWFKDSGVMPQLSVSPLEKAEDIYFDGDAIGYRLDVDAISIYSHFHGIRADGFLPLLFGMAGGKPIESSNGEDVRGEIAQELLKDFIFRWWKPAAASEALEKYRWVHSSLPESLCRRGSGVLLVGLSIGAAKVTFMVPPEVLQRLPLNSTPGITANKRTVSRVSEVLGRESVRLFVTTHAAEAVPFSALSDLNVGDVILLNRRVQEPFDLINANGDRLGGCHIGRRGENRAIHIAANAAAGNLKGLPNKS